MLRRRRLRRRVTPSDPPSSIASMVSWTGFCRIERSLGRPPGIHDWIAWVYWNLSKSDAQWFYELQNFSIILSSTLVEKAQKLMIFVEIVLYYADPTSATADHRTYLSNVYLTMKILEVSVRHQSTRSDTCLTSKERDLIWKHKKMSSGSERARSTAAHQPLAGHWVHLLGIRHSQVIQYSLSHLLWKTTIFWATMAAI